MNWYKDEYGMKAWAMVACFLLVIAVLLVGLGVGAFFVDRAACDRKAERLGSLAHQYDFWGGGCYVELPDGRYVSPDNYRVTIEEGER